MADTRQANDNPEPVPALRGFWQRHVQVLATIFVVAASAVSVGPDSWMEWLFWGTTVVSHETARITLGILAIVIAVAVAWPVIRRSP